MTEEDYYEEYPEPPNYTRSIDHLIPVIEKLFPNEHIEFKLQWFEWGNSGDKRHWEAYFYDLSMTHSGYCGTPAQALAVACCRIIESL